MKFLECDWPNHVAINVRCACGHIERVIVKKDEAKERAAFTRKYECMNCDWKRQHPEWVEDDDDDA